MMMTIRPIFIAYLFAIDKDIDGTNIPLFGSRKELLRNLAKDYSKVPKSMARICNSTPVLNWEIPPSKENFKVSMRLYTIPIP